MIKTNSSILFGSVLIAKTFLVRIARELDVLKTSMDRILFYKASKNKFYEDTELDKADEYLRDNRYRSKIKQIIVIYWVDPSKP